ncbi:MAG: HAD-IC family P-type ATPase [Rhodocyclaceae bacterium]|nr:HAD-IC family P-type ATPase [Rhodocyclaceae bacterium]MBX3670828.1 HAD-IC family P-type ATPase [Rhodocyclaceae bacterium]
MNPGPGSTPEGAPPRRAFSHSDAAPAEAAAARSWHALTATEVARQLDVDPASGLAEASLRERLARYGPNRLPEAPARPAWRKFLDQFRSLLVLVLLGAAVLAGTVGNLHDALVIACVVCANAVIGFLQERRSEAALAALGRMLAPQARVRRAGRTLAVPASDLVPGDLLLLEAGDRVAADARVLYAHAAQVAEAALTGEAQPVHKTQAVVESGAPLAERSSMVHTHTVVTHGRIEAIVTATGAHTEIGRLAGLIATAQPQPTPLQRDLDRLGKRLAAIAAAVVGALFALGLARGDDFATTAITAIALAVAAIPEGLPAVVTLTLALGMRRMAERNAVVRRLAAVETLGCTSVICTDKTGTLTENRMCVRRLYFAGREFETSGSGYDGAGAITAMDAAPLPPWQGLVEAAALCADARVVDGKLLGDPTEGALLALVMKTGADPLTLAEKYPRLAEIPFDPAARYMATFHRDGDFVRMWVKGAPDLLVDHATQVAGPAGMAVLDAAARAALEAEQGALAERGMRVLALAGRSIPATQFDAGADLRAWLDELSLIALAGITDPPRREVMAALQQCRAAGIAVKMLTGDHRATAAAIATELGLAGEVHEGRELDALDAAALGELVERSAVFARVAPEHKMRIVRALQARGHVVAMTGDGVNDAPALKTADIGVAMGAGGTEVAKEAAALVLSDDNFASIVAAVREGRTIYDNIVKFVRFQLATNIGALVTVAAAPLAGVASPLTAIQILWVNIIMDGPPALTLGVEPARPGIMRAAPRRPGAQILNRARLVQVALAGLVMAAGTLAAYAHGFAAGGRAYALSLAFTTFVLFQVFNLFNARTERDSAFNRQFFANGKLWAALAGITAMQVLALHTDIGRAVFATVALSVQDWLWALAVAVSILLVEETRKLALRRMDRACGQSRRAPPKA